MIYLCHTSYGATGEGQSEWVSTHYCDTKEEARRLHREKFALPDFFERGVTAVEINEKNRQYISDVLSVFISAPVIQGLFSQCFVELSFYFHANCS